MGRGMQIAVCGAIAVGSVGGGLAAWVSPPGSPAPPQPAARPSSAEAPPPDPKRLLAMQMKAVLSRFTEWSRNHAGAPCPASAALGVVALDPWGNPIELTCTDQPDDQRAGAISAGPDGIVGNRDDVASWALGRDVTEGVRGARWTSTPAATAAPAATKTQAGKRGKERSSARDRAPTTPPTLSPAPSTTASPPRTSAAPAVPTAPAQPGTLPLDAGADDIPARR